LKKITAFLTVLLIVNAGLSQPVNEEFRATWVITWDHSKPSDSPNTGKARIKAILERHATANMNAVLFQVRQGGTVYFTSSYEPWGSYVGYAYPGFDPLAYAVSEAHKLGLELHAWFNVFQCSSTIAGSPSAEHPEWICRDQDGNPMDSYRSTSPGLSAVRNYTVKVAMEIVNNYDIDGLHLDYVRWNEHTNSARGQAYDQNKEEIPYLDGFIEPERLQDLLSNRSGRYLYDIEHPYSNGVPQGFNSWEDWWRWSVTEFVTDLHDSIQSVKPHIRLSAAALGKYNWSGWQGYGTVYQDAALWFNEGYIDQLTPMHYHWITGAGFFDMLTGDCPDCWSDYIQPGLAAGRLFTVGPGSYILAENGIWNNHEDIINTCRLIPWVDGFQFFAYNSWQSHAYWIAASNSFFNTKSKIRSAPDPLGQQPNPPTISITKIDTFTYEITVVPVDSLLDNWFTVYRSEGLNLDIEKDPIIDIHFGKEPYSVQDIFSGNQEYLGQFSYGTSQFDRYWNESALSNIVSTDTIPTTAPPGSISSIAVTNLGSAMLQIDFSGSSSAEEYLIINDDWNRSVYDTIGIYRQRPVIISGLITDQIYYLRIKGINEFGESPLTDRIAVALSSETVEIVLINDFMATANTQSPDYLERPVEAIESAGFGFDNATGTATVSGLLELSDYQMVIWSCGDLGSETGTIDAMEQQVIMNYLESGGNLMITGSEIGWDLVDRGTSYDQEFYRTYLKANFKSDNGEQFYNNYTCTGSLQGIFIGNSNIYFDDGSHGTYNVSSPDGILPIGGADLCLEYAEIDPNENGGAGIQYQGKFGTSDHNGRLIYLAVPFETIYPEQNRNNLMSHIIEYFKVEITSPTVDQDFQVSVYPNPGRHANLNYSLSSDSPLTGEMTIRIYDILGRELIKANYTISGANQYHSHIRLYDRYNRPLASGIYFLMIKINDQRQITKFTHLK